MINKVKNFLVSSFDELRYKVTWPTMKELQQSTVLVLVASLIFALIIGIIDFSFDKLMSLIY